jgi:hypothetical protein
MPNAWGHPVHSRHPMTPLSEDCSVDRKAVIVRNRGEGKKKMAHVGNLGKGGRSCAGRHLVDQAGIGLLIHKSPVPTGTTGILEFIKS